MEIDGESYSVGDFVLAVYDDDPTLVIRKLEYLYECEGTFLAHVQSFKKATDTLLKDAAEEKEIFQVTQNYFIKIIESFSNFVNL